MAAPAGISAQAQAALSAQCAALGALSAAQLRERLLQGGYRPEDLPSTHTGLLDALKCKLCLDAALADSQAQFAASQRALAAAGVSSAGAPPPNSINGSRECGNPRCPRPEAPTLGCAACSNAAFCGPACQRAAWKQHRPLCAEWRDFYARHPQQPRTLRIPTGGSVLEDLALRTGGGDPFVLGLLAAQHHTRATEGGEAEFYDPFARAARAAAAGGCASAQLLLATALAVGGAGAHLGMTRAAALAEAHALAQAAAAQGSPRAHSLLGQLLCLGLGAPADEAGGCEWLARAASAGDAGAQAFLGDLRVRQGRAEEARALLEAAAAARGVEGAAGKLSLAEWLVEGGAGGRGRDRQRALALAEACAEEVRAPGRLQAAALCGVLLSQAAEEAAGEEGKARLLRRAFMYTTCAAREGHAEAQCNLGLCLLRGVGCGVDAGQAEQWLRKAAAGGCDRAAQLLQL